MSEKLPTEAMIEAGIVAWPATEGMFADRRDYEAEAVTAIYLAMQAARPTEDAVERVALLKVLAPFAKEAERWNMEESALAYSFAGTGLSRGDIKRAADLHALTDTTKDAAHD